MKTSVKILIASAVTAIAATVSTGASAASILELHEQHKAQVLNFLFGGNDRHANVHVGPAYQAPPVYVDPYAGRPGYRGGRGYERRDHHNGYNGYDGRGRNYGNRGYGGRNGGSFNP